MSILKYIPFFLLISLLSACDIGHEHDDHDNGPTKKDSSQTSIHRSEHEDLFDALDLDETEDHPEGEIIFSIEQQKLVEFAVSAAKNRQMHPSLKATGTLQASPGGQSMITAPVTGYLAIEELSFPSFGDPVKKGDALIKIVPRLEGEVDPASLNLQVRRSKSNHQLATKELNRLESLYRQGIVPERRVQEAQKEEQVARAELESAQDRLKQFNARPEKMADYDKALAITSPIDGILDGVYVSPGAYLQEGDALLHVVNTQTLRLEIRIPEADIASLVNPRGAWFTVDGYKDSFHIDLSRGDRLVASGNIIDPKNRTVPLVFEFPNINNKLRIGMFARVHVIVDKALDAIAIPASAIQEHNGMDVVYVQLHDDAFERRVIKTGIRDGAFVQVADGMKPGEKVVTKGAYLIQLAASGPQEAGHGHAH